MNAEIILKEVEGAGSHWWLPLFIWTAYFFWCRFLDYPTELERLIKNNKSWPYLPMYWKGIKRKAIRFISVLLFWLGNLSFACVSYYLFPHIALLAVGMALSIFVKVKIRFYATREIISLQQDRHFQIYTQLKNNAQIKGDDISEDEISSRSQWQHQNDLRIADKQGRLMEFLRGDAKL